MGYRKIKSITSKISRDCNLVSLFYFEFKHRFIKGEKPTQREVEIFIKGYQEQEMPVDGKAAIKWLKQL